MGELLKGVGELLLGLSAVVGAIRAHQGARTSKATKEVIEEKVLPSLANHEALIQSAERRGRLADVFMQDYLERHPEMKEIP